MAKYLVDVNLPRYFSLWHSADYKYVSSIDDEMKDSQVWQYAKENNLTIISKDADFKEMILTNNPPPRFIHVKLGNMKISEFHQIITTIWDEVCDMSDRYKLVIVYQDRIEGIG